MGSGRYRLSIAGSLPIRRAMPANILSRRTSVIPWIVLLVALSTTAVAVYWRHEAVAAAKGTAIASARGHFEDVVSDHERQIHDGPTRDRNRAPRRIERRTRPDRCRERVEQAGAARIRDDPRYPRFSFSSIATRTQRRLWTTELISPIRRSHRWLTSPRRLSIRQTFRG